VITIIYLVLNYANGGQFILYDEEIEKKFTSKGLKSLFLPAHCPQMVPGNVFLNENVVHLLPIPLTCS